MSSLLSLSAWLGGSELPSFPKKQLFLLLTFPIDFVFPISLISAQNFIIYFLSFFSSLHVYIALYFSFVFLSFFFLVSLGESLDHSFYVFFLCDICINAINFLLDTTVIISHKLR